MSYFTMSQDKILKEILEDIIKEGKNREQVEKIKKYNLLEAVGKNAYYESTMDDVELVAENQGIELTFLQLQEITHIVMSKYDHSDYNDYISELIERYT